MVDWLVITADRTNAGRGVRGQTLACFLRTYFGRRAVAMQTPEQWRRGPAVAETIFVGLPSSFTPEELQRLGASCRRLAAFDYLDQQELAWTPEQEATLRQRTDCYLKPWFERAWRHRLRMGMLPIRRYGRFTAAVAVDRFARRWTRRPARTYDVAFVGRPNETRIYVDGRVEKMDQRFHWLSEIVRDAPELRLWGGLVEICDGARGRIESSYGDFHDLLHREDKVGFATYYRAMQRSRALLAPGGNVPWSYRHYECLYAGGVVVTIDYRERDMLVPLPTDNMIHVPDGASVLPAVREAIELSERRPDLGEEYVAHLEQYLRFGAYSSRRPALLERFVSQL
ncbi:MAG: hypothetical protein JNL18_04790 [Planctomycetaceae bacterium]|nr:hypothetical protein [Planctomycetaceae bacterium]